MLIHIELLTAIRGFVGAMDAFNALCDAPGPMPDDKPALEAAEAMRTIFNSAACLGLDPNARTTVESFFLIWDNLEADGPISLDFWVDELRALAEV